MDVGKRSAAIGGDNDNEECHMKNHMRLSFSAGNLRPNDIVGKFLVAGHAYWIVKVNAAAGDSSDVAPSECSNGEICRFESEGQSFAILRSFSDATNDNELAAVLTARELQIATLVALGCPNKVVAHKLHISEWTVATHLRRIFAKLGVETRAAMAFRCAPLIERQGSELLSALSR